MNHPTRGSLLFSPLLAWELVRQARRGQVTRSRVLFLYTWLLVLIGFAIVWSYPCHPSRFLSDSTPLLPVAEAAQFTSALMLLLLQVQLIFVAIVAPALAVTTLAEEKDRHTLALVLTTDLTDREIVWGKALACVLLLLGTITAGLPLLIVLSLMVPVDLLFLAAGYALTLGTALLATAIGINAACLTSNSRSALLRAYGLSAVLVGGMFLPPFVFFSPFAMLAYCRMNLGSEALHLAMGFGYPVGQAVISGVLLLAATRQLRQAGPSAGPTPPTAFPEPPLGRLPPLLFVSRPPTPVLPALAGTDPILWKERHVSQPRSSSVFETPARWLAALATVLALALFVSAGWLLLKRALLALDPNELLRLTSLPLESPDRAGLLLMLAGSLSSALYLVPLAIRISGCIARERQQATLDSLLATPISRWRLLRSKVQAHLEQGLVFAVGATVAYGSAFGIQGGWQLGLVAIGVFVGSWGLVAGVSAWLSVHCATPLRAFRLSLPVLVSTLSLLPIVWLVAPWANTSGPTQLLTGIALTFILLGLGFFWHAGSHLDGGE